MIEMVTQDDGDDLVDVIPKNLEPLFTGAAQEPPEPPVAVAPVAMIPVVVATECEEIPLTQPRGDLDDLNQLELEVGFPNNEPEMPSPVLEPEIEDVHQDMKNAQPPPTRMGESNMKARLRRIFLPRADGSFLVPDDLVAEYKNLDTRPRISALFEKVGYEPDWVANTWKKHMPKHLNVFYPASFKHVGLKK